MLSDGERVAALVPAQDHKRIGDGDTGANTGGMGAYSIDSLLDAGMTEWLLNHVARPVIAGMKSEGAEYRGILYCGLMMTARGPMVLEFNCRFGDPETQAVLMRLDSDLLDAIEAAVEGRVSDGVVQMVTRRFLLRGGGLRRVSGKLCERKTDFRTGPRQQPERCKSFSRRHQQARRRVLYQWRTRAGRDRPRAGISEAISRAYEAVRLISFEDMYYRKDIGARALKALK